MIRIKNLEEAEALFASGRMAETYPREAIPAIRRAVMENLKIMTDAYGNDGAGGYLAVMEKDLCSAEGKKEYDQEMLRFYLDPDMCEFSDLLYDTDGVQVKLQLFVMTEYHLLLLIIIRKRG